MTSSLDQQIRAQLGIVTYAQCLAGGMSRAAVRHLVESGRWVRLFPAVFATFTGTPTYSQRLLAATLFVGPEAAVTGAAACRLLGFRYAPPAAVIDVLVPPASGVRRRSTTGVRICRSERSWRPWFVEGVRATPSALSVVEACRRLDSLRDVRALVAEAVQRDRATVEELAAEAARAPRRGSRLLHIALDDVRAGCRSAPEGEFRDLVRTSRVLPEPEWNARLVVPGYGVVYPDALWRAVRLIGEVNSAAHHADLADWEDTMARQAALQAAGFAVLPVGPGQIRRQPRPVLSRFEQAYLGRLAAAA